MKIGKTDRCKDRLYLLIILANISQDKRERSSDTSACLGGIGLSQNADTADALERGWGVKFKMITC